MTISFRFLQVNGDCFWSTTKDKYVGRVGKVVTIMESDDQANSDRQKCRVAILSFNGNVLSSWYFRIRDLTIAE